MNPLTFAVSPGEQICCFMEQEKRASKSEDAVRVRSWEQAGEHIFHDAALYLPPKWHLYLPKLSFDSLPHTEQQITFNTDIKSSSKVCPKRWKAALLCGTWLLSPLFTVSPWLTVAKLKKKKSAANHCFVCKSYCAICHNSKSSVFWSLAHRLTLPSYH